MVHNQEVDNRWVVSYNRSLITKYNCHMNVELCARTRVIKYLFKYLHKGPDRATIVFELNSSKTTDRNIGLHKNNDEAKQYLDCRYVSAPEACWRIFEFYTQGQQPFVERLQFHLPNKQYVILNDNDNLYEIVENPNVRITMFTKWMDTNRKFDDARALKYIEFPTAWVWDRKEKEWHHRKKKRAIGKLYFAHPSSGEHYYENIRTVNGIVYPDFKSGCGSLGLLEDDNEWLGALAEASIWASAAAQQSELVDLIRKASLIIWDDAPMIHRYAIESVDRTFKDLLKNTSTDAGSKVFGGKTIVLGGDFRQILPVIPKASRQVTVAACLQKSYLWSHCKLHYLIRNMRLSGEQSTSIENRDMSTFATWVLEVGNGHVPMNAIGIHTETDWIMIPDDMLIDDDNSGIIRLISEIYTDFPSKLHEDSYLEQRAILASRNDDVDHINLQMLDMLPGVDIPILLYFKRQKNWYFVKF
ncbi:uncharacterized protein LOC143867189 [Tasmannia lanceolata]|uniref:uncharacterized protein LOC143867189 n=1 Tax=Tasmannia lanceolata TaxID=3420 RepID=UPI0040644FBF